MNAVYIDIIPSETDGLTWVSFEELYYNDMFSVDRDQLDKAIAESAHETLGVMLSYAGPKSLGMISTALTNGAEISFDGEVIEGDLLETIKGHPSILQFGQEPAPAMRCM